MVVLTVIDSLIQMSFSDGFTTKTEENSLFMEIGKKSLSPLKLTLTLRAKDGMGREWKLAWVKANED